MQKIYFNTKPEKNLGQNFLLNKSFVEKLLKYLKKDENILEIGPGKGFITEDILKKTHNITCIEKDERLIPLLVNKFPKIEIINTDILKYNFETIPYLNFSLISALPYYISKDIISLFLKNKIRANNIYVILQKEVAEKYSTPGEKLYNTLRIYAENVEKGDLIKKDNFYPIPKVDSQIIYIKNIYKYNKEQKEFEGFINRGFSNPRKKLSNVLVNFNLDKFKDKRAQDLMFEDWKYLFSLNQIHFDKI